MTYVQFEDAMLEAAVRELISPAASPNAGRNAEKGVPVATGAGAPYAGGPIKKSEARRWARLDLSGLNIHSLRGLESFENLIELNLADNKLTDLSPLQSMSRLETLVLSRNQISDLTPLGNLSSLANLDVGQNKITDIAPLQDLPVLDILVLSGNQELWSLAPGSDTVSVLEVERCNLRDLTGLGEFPNLLLLAAGHNHIMNIDGLGDCPKLVIATLEGNDIMRLPEVHLPLLAQLTLSNNAIHRIERFPDLPDLVRLELAGNEISSLPDINPLPNLKVMNLDDNPLSESICVGAAYYRQQGISIETNQCPDIPVVVEPETSRLAQGGMPGWKRRMLDRIEKDRNRSMTPGFTYHPHTPQGIDMTY